MRLPASLRVETSTACQLRCPTCPTADGKTRGTIGIGYLKPTDFEALLEKNPRVRHVELSNWGEMFLNPELVAILEAADRRGVALSADNGVNLNHADDRVLEALVKHRFRSMTCSIDGASEETYKIYRRGGSLARVLSRIRRLNELKTRHGSQEPRLRWLFVAFGHNQHEIPAARALAAELNMTFFVKLAWQDLYAPEEFSPVTDAAAIARETGLGVADRREYYARNGVAYHQRTICSQLWKAPQINWDGRMLGCCVNYWGDFGNVFRDGLSETFHGGKMSYARAMLEGKKPARADIPCTTCSFYLTMKRDGNWMGSKDLRGTPWMSRAARALKRRLRRASGAEIAAQSS